jgi:hypothetical protein
MSEKKKNQTSQIGTVPFVLLWTLSYALGWLTLMGGGMLIDKLYPPFFNLFPEWVYFVPLGLIPGLISGVIQQQLLRWKFAVQIKRWWLWSTSGAILAAGGFYIVLEPLARLFNVFFNYFNQFNEIIGPALIIGSLFALYSSAQSWLLRHDVKRVWMWSAAAFVSAATFVLPLQNMGGLGNQLRTLITFGGAGLLQGAVMGLTLVWLFGMTKTEPLKRGMESTKLAQAEENLAERDILNPNIEDYLAAQSMGQRK